MPEKEMKRVKIGLFYKDYKFWTQEMLHFLTWPSLSVGKQGIENADTSWAQRSPILGMHSDSCYHNIVYQSYSFSFMQAWLFFFWEITMKLNKNCVIGIIMT